MYPRELLAICRNGLDQNPVTAILGPRQCGKTTLAKELLKDSPGSQYLDLEKPSDLAKLENAEWFFESHREQLICLDEIQRRPDLFPVIRSISDKNDRNGQFLILGYASRDLLKQSSESLAGRITYKSLGPLLYSEIREHHKVEDYLSRGGFPRSLKPVKDRDSFTWREDFITTFIERDVLQWVNSSSVPVRRLMTMLAHYNGQLVNYSTLGNSLGISNVSVKNYIDLLSSAFMLDSIPPHTGNLGKRLVKSPKVYFRDTGIVNALLGLENFEQCAGHPAFGAIWETLILTNLRGHFSGADISFYRTLRGAELDFILTYRGKTIAVECKTNPLQVLSRGNYSAIEDIKPDISIIIAPVEEAWMHKDSVLVAPLPVAIQRIKELFH